MTKYILTTQKINCDYKKQFFHSIKVVIIIPIVFVLLIAFITFLFSRLERSIPFLLLEILLVSPAIFGVYICLATLIEAYKDYKTIEKGHFKIVTDKLISKQEKATYIGSAFTASFSHPYILAFASYGEYCILDGENYSSSTLYNMSDKGVFINSCIGDTFYLIIDTKERILLAYNTKLFDFLD